MARTYRYVSADDDVRILLEKFTDAVITDVQIEYCIDIACNIIDSKLAYKYSVPFTTTYPMINVIATHLACYLVLRRIYSKTRPAEGNSWIDVFKNYADDLLKGVVEGSIMLIDSTGSDVATKTDYGIIISTSDYVPIFNEGDELDWGIDDDKVEDAMDGR